MYVGGIIFKCPTCEINIQFNSDLGDTEAVLKCPSCFKVYHHSIKANAMIHHIATEIPDE